jgi:TolA-binding protein
MKTSKFQHRFLGLVSFRSLLLFSVLSFRPLFAQSVDSLDQSPQYYLQLKKEEFLSTMIAKEKYLLGLAQNVNLEIESRRAEGVPASEMGVREIISPQDQVVNAYEREINRILVVLERIEELEREARRKADLEALEALSGLKKRVQEVLLEERAKAEGTAEGDPRAARMPQSDDGSASVEVGEELAAGADADRVFDQWKYNRILDYNVKWTQFQFLRIRLLHTAGTRQEQRMFQRDLRDALETYQSGDFVLARLQLRDIINTFSDYSYMEDVLYYASEASYGLSYLDEAMSGYLRLMEEYPNSGFAPRAMMKLIYIYTIYDQYDNLFQTYDRLQMNSGELDPEMFSNVSYLVAYSYFKQGSYDKALQLLGRVSRVSRYYFPALYLSGACYSNMDQDSSALALYHRLAGEDTRNDPILEQIRNNALLKLGFIYYERGDNPRATGYFNQVSENYRHYDLSLLGKAWSAFRAGRPGVALENVEKVLQQATLSSYTYEARVLAASSKDLLGQSEEAIQDLKQVYQVGSGGQQTNRYDAQNLASSRDWGRPESPPQQNDWDRELFQDLDHIRSFLESSSAITGSIRGSSEISTALPPSMETLEQKVEILDRLEQEARESGDAEQLREIRELRSDLIQALEDQSDRLPDVGEMTSQDPLIRRMGMSEYTKYLFQSLLLETLREKEQTREDIEKARRLLGEAKEQDRFQVQISMEITLDELENYYGKLNQYEVWLRENSPREFRVELDKWASFSGYGISNINFQRIKECDQRTARISEAIGSLDRVFQVKRRRLENRIQGLLTDVATIEKQMRREAEQRQMKEQENFFKSEYFEKHVNELGAGEFQEKPTQKEQKQKKEQEKKTP